MTPQDIIDGHTTRQGADIIEALNTAGYIIVRKGAVGQAQREAVAQYQEDAANDNAAHMTHKAG